MAGEAAIADLIDTPTMAMITGVADLSMSSETAFGAETAMTSLETLVASMGNGSFAVGAVT